MGGHIMNGRDSKHLYKIITIMYFTSQNKQFVVVGDLYTFVPRGEEHTVLMK